RIPRGHDLRPALGQPALPRHDWGPPHPARSQPEAPGLIAVPDAVRVRFAPSPTGMFHVGSGRSALWNWLYARQRGGVFVLRIEDTDEARNEPQWVEGIHSALRWLDLDWDEEYRQSDQAAAHRAAAA